MNASVFPHRSNRVWFWISILLLSHYVYTTHSLGVRSPSKKVKIGGGGGGFSKQPVASSFYTPDNSKHIENLVQFLKSQKAEGVNDKNTVIGVSQATNMRGVFATKSFKKNDILCKIPSDCALALSDPSLNDVEMSLANGGYNFLHMYKHHPSNSKLWEPYLNSLPTLSSEFDPTPDFFSPEEIMELEHPRAVKAVQERLQDIETLLKEHQDKDLDRESLQFATWLVSSRSFSISMSETEEEEEEDAYKSAATTKKLKSIRVLLPYIDMINHSSNNAPNCRLHLIDPEKDDAWFAIQATRPIPEHKELTIAYGSGLEGSIELLLKYGFVPSENKVDALAIKKNRDKDGIESLEGWKTTLEEDRALYDTAEGNMKQVLALRIKLKQAYKNKK